MHLMRLGTTNGALMVTVSVGIFDGDAVERQQTKLFLDFGIAADRGAVSLRVSAVGGVFERISNMPTASNHWRVRKHWTAQ